MKPSNREWISFGAVAIALIAISVTAVVAGRTPDQQVGTRRTNSPSPAPTDGSSEYFDGTIQGWRIAADEVLEREGLDRNLNVDCEPKQVGAKTKTDLDFKVTYIPKGIGTPAHEPNVGKWICGGRGLSVRESRDWDDNPYDGLATLEIERAVWGSRARSLYAPKDQVGACSIGAKKAICVHYENDAKGRGLGGTILVIEDDELDPWVTALLISASGIPYDELVKIAEGIR